MTSRIDMIIQVLKANPERKFTARELAQACVVRYSNELAEKRSNPRFKSEEDFISQLTAENSDRTEAAKRQCANVATRDQPRPRLYYWQENPEQVEEVELEESELEDSELEDTVFEDVMQSGELSEHELYPLLARFLRRKKGLYCQRIDEKKSKFSCGSGGNQWFHPDIVAMEPLDKGWNEEIKKCVYSGNGSSIRLWSFVVKKQLSKGNVRQCFFQAVSNSSWAHFGYLVSTGFNEDVESELQILSGLHGIGVIVLNTESLFDSQILIPAKERPNIDWQSANRIAMEHPDFNQYIRQVGMYSSFEYLDESEWKA